MAWAAPGAGLRVGGHRGASALAPENTMASFRMAAAAGADYLELDVQLSLDGELMVFHDETLERTSDGHGRMDGMSAAELARLDAGAWFDARFAAERIPRVSEVLAWLETLPDTGATFEAKGSGTGARLAQDDLRQPHRAAAVHLLLRGDRAAEPPPPSRRESRGS